MERTRQSISTAEIAHAVGITEKKLEKYENGDAQILMYIFFLISRYLRMFIFEEYYCLRTANLKYKLT